MTRKKRGAQPGNTNALKHGFYSKQLKDLSPAEIDAAFDVDLASEIAILRLATRRLLEFAEGEPSYESAAQTLSLIAMATGKLARLMRVQQLLGRSQEDEATAAINQALNEVVAEMQAEGKLMGY